MKRAAIVIIEPGLTRLEEMRLADGLSTMAAEILKGERKRGWPIWVDVIDVQEGG